MKLLLSIILPILLCACAGTPPKHADAPGGGYAGIHPYYEALANGTLTATDGTNTYALVSPAQDMGGGYGKPECWKRVNAPNTRCYQRTWQTFQNQAMKPVFVEGGNF